MCSNNYSFDMKMKFLINLMNINNNLSSLLLSVKTNNVLNNCNNNCVKMCRISTECKALEENEDKLKCNKHFNCFWPKCRFTTDCEYHLNQHISVHLNKRQFICNECNKRFIQKSHLIQHKQRIHSNDRPFVCPVSECGKRFKTKDVLISHKAIHSSEKPFKCDVKDCDKSFRRNSHLISHKKRIHYRLKSHKCFHNNCDKSFVSSSELKQHIRSKHIN